MNFTRLWKFGVLILIYCLVVYGLAKPPSVPDDGWRLTGIFLATVAGYTGAAIANRRAQDIPLASRTLVSFVGCAVIAWTMVLSVLFLPSLSMVAGAPSAAPMLQSISAITGTVWAWLMLFATVWLLGGTILTTYGVTHVQASRAAVLQVVELLVAIVSAVLLGGETLGFKECVGGAMIIAATMLEARG